jgi:hypothetical protein
MPFQNTSFQFNSHASALLAAIRAPDDLTGTAAAVPILSSCLEAAAELWPIDALIRWALVPREMHAALRLPSNTQPALHLYSQPTDPSQLYRKFIGWRAPTERAGIAFEAHALLGRTIALSAARKAILPAELLAGLFTIRLAQEVKGKRSVDWAPLTQARFSDATELKTLRQNLPPSSRPWTFLDCAIKALDSLVLPPEVVARVTDESADSGPVSELDKASQSARFETPSDEKLLSTDKTAVSTPDISARLAAAEFSSFAEKLGLYQRDHMLVDDLTFTTAQLAGFLQNGTPVQRGFAFLAVLSLVTGCSDEVALLLKFRPSDSIWLDLGRGAWAWDFTVYRQSKSDLTDVDQVDPIFCPWPSIIDPLIRTASERCPGAATLKDLILNIQQVEKFDLEGFRQFLRNCGHPSHPPYRGRFARSMPAVYLQTFGSDMTTALMTGFFASTAPAALFYYSPTYDLLVRRVSAVYERLSLGPPSQLFLESGRAGCKNVLESGALQKGWAGQVESINACRTAALGARAADAIVNFCNRWLSLLCAALVVQTGHRGSRLECLTAGALYGHPSVMSIQDKDEGGRAQPRLIPKTLIVRQILGAISDCHRVMYTIAHRDAKTPPNWDAADLIFVRWQLVSGTLSAAVLATSAVAAVTAEFFEAKVNFGRSLWVTNLDENGCDRWLTRSLTGHTRDVTRVHGPYFGIPPVVVATRLGAEMDKTGARMFGEPVIQASSGTLPLRPALIKPRPFAKVVSGPIPDPRTLLDPLISEVLIEWDVADQLRRDLLDGTIDAPLPALAALHLALLDLIPCPDNCLDAVVDRQGTVKIIGTCAGLMWVRNHFVHPTWIPIQPATARLLDRLGDSTISREDILTQICRAVRGRPYAKWPTSNLRCWEAINTAACSFRRLTFPPSLSAVSHLAVGAPCLSELSLTRLADVLVNPCHLLPGMKPVRARASGKSGGARYLITTLSKFASSLERHGEKRARAIKCLEELDTEPLMWTPFILWVKYWCIDELRRSRDRLEGCYQISSIVTYATTILIGHAGFDMATDPADWEDGEWVGWITQINTLGSAETALQTNLLSDQGLTDRTKNAVGALVRSLIRRHEYVPLEVRILVGLTSRSVIPRGSASACLITPADQARALAICHEWNTDFPGDHALADLRKTVGEMVPVRAGDVSSLSSDCLTPAGGLVIKRMGYDVHKNQNAVRVVHLPREQAQLLRTKIETLRAHFGERPLLLRGHGSAADGLRDHRLATEWGAALKLALADASARPYSIRAATLQEMAWPGSLGLSNRVLTNTATPTECQQWVERQQLEWCRLSQAVAKAGQGDLRSALGNYLAIWPLIYAIHASASLAKAAPGAGLFRQLGLSTSNLRQARSRSHRKASSDRAGQSDQFNVWGWIASKTASPLVKRRVQEPSPPAPAEIEVVPSNKYEDEDGASTDQEKLVYLVLRILGVAPAAAVEKSRIRFRTSVQLEPFLPAESAVAKAVSRGRQGPETRGAQADIKTALSSQGLLLLDWLRSLDVSMFPILRQSLLRNEPPQLAQADRVAFWRKVADSLPAAFSARARIGAKHLTSAEKSVLGTLAPRVVIASDPRIGVRPIVSLHLRETENLVLSARLTSVARVCLLAIDSLDQFWKARTSC